MQKLIVTQLVMVLLKVFAVQAQAAPKGFCQEYAREAIKQYAFMQEHPSYDCHENHDGALPMWSPDPYVHEKWCESKWVTESFAKTQTKLRDEFIFKKCASNALFYEQRQPQTTQE